MKTSFLSILIWSVVNYDNAITGKNHSLLVLNSVTSFSSKMCLALQSKV